MDEEYKGIDSETLEQIRNDRFSMFYKYVEYNGEDYKLIGKTRTTYKVVSKDDVELELPKEQCKLVNKYIKGTFKKKMFHMKWEAAALVFFLIVSSYFYAHDTAMCRAVIEQPCNYCAFNGITATEYANINGLNAQSYGLPVVNGTNLTFNFT
jgi:hypothetical protein